MNDKRYLLELISEGEHQQQDFKYRVDDARKLARSVSAFANTDGGRLLIGVRDDGHIAGVRTEGEIYVMHQAAYKYCQPEASIRFDTYHADGKAVVIATVPPSDKRPVCAPDEDGQMRAYIRIKDENIVASPVLYTLLRESQKPQGALLVYDDDIRRLLGLMEGRLTLGQIIRLSRLPRHKVITLLAHLIRFGTVQWDYVDQEFLFGLASEGC
ncbi:MAG: putative DNA binding domain-containing protein [Bacteroidales bacterium]|nr:putative DNA binding domain-containing protein [Bacteroidales bacterium]